MRNTRYTTELSQGAGLINETLSLLYAFQDGMNREDLLEYARKNDTLSCQTDIRLHHIIYRVFYHRFLKTNKEIPMWLKRVREQGLPLKQFIQLLFIYCAREHAVLFDFIVEVLNKAKETKKTNIDVSCIRVFMMDAVQNGKASWSEAMQKKNAGYVRSTLIDFELLDKNCNILPYEPSDFTILYLMYEQHFAGLSDMAIWEMQEWQLFNLDRHQVLARIMHLSLRGAYIAQTSGDLLNISWNYQTMEEFIDATL